MNMLAYLALFGCMAVVFAFSLLFLQKAWSKRLAPIVFGALVVTGVFFHTHVYDRQGTTPVLFPHVAEHYHYLIGSKYFGELGYTGIYHATVLADFEDDPEGFQPESSIRNLRYNRSLILRKDARKSHRVIKKHFSDERWEEFKRDIAYFRSFRPDLWQSSHSQIDHGYNGSPLTTLVLGTLANQPFLSTSTFVKTSSWFDVSLLAVLFVIVAKQFSLLHALIFLFLFFVNPLNDFEFIGRSYLRYDYFFALSVGIIAFPQRKVLSGVLFAYAILLRMFPIWFILGLLGLHFLHRNRRALLKQNQQFYASVVISGGLLIGLSSVVDDPSGRNPWVAFYDRISAHHENFAPNVVGLKTLFTYDQDYNMERALQARKVGAPFDWLEKSLETFHQNRWWFFCSCFLLGMWGLIICRNGNESDALFLGMFLIFITMVSSHYYYCILSLVPLIYRFRHSSMLRLITLFFGILVLESIPQIAASSDLTFSAISIWVLIYFLACLVMLRKEHRKTMLPQKSP